MSENLTIKWKIEHILDCIHLDNIGKNINNILNNNQISDEIINDWIYDSSEFPLVYDSYIKYKQVSVLKNLIIDSTLTNYPALSDNIVFLVIMNKNKVIKAIKTSNIMSIHNVADVLTYYFNDIISCSLNVLHYKDIYILVCCY